MLHSQMGIFYGDSVSATVFGDEMGILDVDLNNFNLDDANFNKDDPETIIHVKTTFWRNRYKHCKACKNIYKQIINA